MLILGFKVKIRSFVSSHSRYLSVRRKFLPSLSFSLLKVLITIPTKRLRVKNAPTITKIIKKKHIAGLFLSLKSVSIPVIDIPLYIISVQLARVAT